MASRDRTDRGSPGRYRVDYHVHTEVSHDCGTTLDRIVEHAARSGLDCVVIADHMSVEGALRLRDAAPPGLEVLVGCEYDTTDGAQVIGLGVEHVIGETRLLRLMDAIRAAGGLTLLPHPFRRGGGVFAASRGRSTAFIDEVLARTDIVEAFNGRDHPEHARASRALVEERGLAAVAGSDAHTAGEIGSVYVEYAEDDRAHGRSPREVHFPDQPDTVQSDLRRTLMGAYHRLEPRLPKAVARSYRGLRRELRLDRHTPRGPTRLQYVLPAIDPQERGRP